MGVPTIHQNWVEETSDHTIEGFATKFLYTDPRIAYLDFKAAIEKSRLKAQSKTSVIRKFNTWKTNKSHATLFWMQQRQSVSIKKGKSVATIGLVDAATNELPKAIQNEALTGDEGDASISSIPLQKKRSARYQIRSTSKKTRGGDEAGGDEASDGESDSEVFDDDEGDEEGDDEGGDDGAGVQDEESHWDVIRELREAEKDTEPGFYPLIRALYHAARGERFQTPNPKPALSTQQSFLWDFVYSRLDAFRTMAPSEQKDVFVAVSGIVDLELHALFPQRDDLVRRCRAGVSFAFPSVREQIKSYQVFVDLQDDVEEARLDDLKHQLRIDMAHFEEGSTKMVVAEILMILVKRCVPDKFGRAKRTESSTLFVWYAVWEVLFACTVVEVEVGETILREAQRDQVAVRVVVGSKAAIGRAGVSGRKLDFRLIATIKTGQRFEPFTLSNDEHKGLGSSGLAADVQRKKNMRLNKSIVMNGKVPMATGNVYQDVVGLEGTWNIMCPFEDVMLCCETEEPPLRLPSNEFELGGFLLEDGMERLLAYREHILSLARKVQGLVSNPRRPSISRRGLVPSASVHAHAQSPLQSELSTPVYAQHPLNSLANTPAAWTGAEGHTGDSTGVTTYITGAAVPGKFHSCATTTVSTEEEWTDTSLHPGLCTPPQSLCPRIHPPTFYTPTKPK